MVSESSVRRRREKGKKRTALLFDCLNETGYVGEECSP